MFGLEKEVWGSERQGRSRALGRSVWAQRTMAGAWMKENLGPEMYL